MHENVYIIKAYLAEQVGLYAIKAFSQEEAIDAFRRSCKEYGIDPTVYRTVFIRLVSDEVTMIDSYQAGG